MLTELWIFRRSVSGPCFYRKSILFGYSLDDRFHLEFFTFVKQKRQATIRPPRRIFPIQNYDLTLATVVL